MPLDFSAHRLDIYRFPEWNKVPDPATLSSLLRIADKYEMLGIQSWLFEVVRNTTLETSEGPVPPKPLGKGAPGEPLFHLGKT